MRQFLLDTNIYGEMVVDSDLDSLRVDLESSPHVVIFGSKVVRKELRATPSYAIVHKIMGLRTPLFIS